MNKSLINLGLAMGLLTTAFQANSANNPNSAGNPHSGVVFGIQAGYAKPNLDIHEISKHDINNGNFYYGATLGYDYAIESSWEITIGLETGVFYGKSISTIKHTKNVAKVKAGKAGVSGTGTAGTAQTTDTPKSETKISHLVVPVLGKVQFDVGMGFDLFAKGGVAYTKPSVTKTHSDFEIDWNSDWSPAAGAGFGYRFNNMTISCQYLHVFDSHNKSDNTDNKRSTIDALTLGASITF